MELLLAGILLSSATDAEHLRGLLYTALIVLVVVGLLGLVSGIPAALASARQVRQERQRRKDARARAEAEREARRRRVRGLRNHGYIISDSGFGSPVVTMDRYLEIERARGALQ